MMHVQKVFDSWRLVDLTADDIEQRLRSRLKKRALMKTRKGYRELELLKATTVLQESRVLRRCLNVAVRKKLLPVSRSR
jgi:hypothetical protein